MNQTLVSFCVFLHYKFSCFCIMVHIDNKYIVALRNNDTFVIEEIYKKYASKIKAMVCTNNGDENDAADIFQESLVYIYNRSLNTEFAITCPF